MIKRITRLQGGAEPAAGRVTPHQRAGRGGGQVEVKVWMWVGEEGAREWREVVMVLLDKGMI